MRKLLRIALVAIVPVLLAGCGAPSPPDRVGVPAPVITDRPEAGGASLIGSWPASDDLDGPYVVRSVIDGDTIRVEVPDGDVSVRLIGVDTPETRHPDRPVECWGTEASARTQELLAGGQVWLEFDSSQGQWDQYGRALAYVWVPEIGLVNVVLVAEGFAREYTFDTAYRYQGAFREAERQAQSEGRGLWDPKVCPQ